MHAFLRLTETISVFDLICTLRHTPYTLNSLTFTLQRLQSALKVEFDDVCRAIHALSGKVAAAAKLLDGDTSGMYVFYLSLYL